ncbi:PREDICTED: tetratricopeptide repeat protein 38-like [Acropora digitifera]|uniref:tetratricopeptide repeat protein 38-like n=1 Tax=Acropora digitifera TaxID=70779 RepID=UPI00077A5DF1|nr:PREDICTED: tetratricopeptide repeat protein 38-like [Acropora digitifera]
MSYLHTHWRDLDAWKGEGLPLTTTSNEAAKMYDATVTQHTGWYDEPSVGGIEGSLSKMITADPDFVMGHVLSCGLDLISSGVGIHVDHALKQRMETLESLANKSNISYREKLHAKAVKQWAEGSTAAACLTWEDILIEHPTDMFAVKMAHDSYFYLGYQAQMRDSIARVLPHWNEKKPLYSYLQGMYAFGLVETGFYSEAEKHALKVCCFFGLFLVSFFYLFIYLFFKQGKFDNAVEILKPARYKVVTIGGSNAQRDVFNLFLIHAALNSPKKQHHQLARSLLTERKAKKNNAPMTDRLMAQALALHAE